MHSAFPLLLLAVIQMVPAFASAVNDSGVTSSNAITFDSTIIRENNNSRNSNVVGQDSYSRVGPVSMEEVEATTETINPSTPASVAAAHQEQPEYNKLYRIPCEAGHPCSKDHWCSPSQRCRPCADLEPWCNLTLTIHQNYTACEHYCYRYEMQKTKGCEREKMKDREKIIQLQESLEEAGNALNETSKQAAIDRETCSSKRTELSQKYQQQHSANKELEAEIKSIKAHIEEYRQDIQNLKEKGEQYRADRERWDRTSGGLTAAVVVVTLLWLGTVGLAVTIYYRQRRLPLGEREPQNQINEDNRQLLPTEAEPKKPVQAYRHSTHFGQPQLSRDDYCLPGRGSCAHVPGDAQVVVS